MSDENEQTPPSEEGQPESQPENSSPDESQADAESVDASDIVGEDAEMTAEEAETLAAAMAAINQVQGGAVEPEPEADEEMTSEEAETLAAAMAAINQVQGVADSAAPSAPASPQPNPVVNVAPDAKAYQSPIFNDDISGAPKEGIDLLSDVHMDVRIELGRTKMYVEDVLKLSDGAVVELDKLAGDAVDVYVNDRIVARGEVLVLNDLFCVRVSEIIDISSTDN